MTNKPASSSAGTLAAAPFALTAAQIRASAATPITLVTAPGTNQALVPVLIVYGYTFVSVAYTSGVFNVAAGNGTVSGIAAGSSVVGAILPLSLPGAARAGVVNRPVTFSLLAAGPIATSAVVDGGSLYAVNDTGTFIGGTGVGATYRVNTVTGGGAILTYTVTNPGTGYEVDDATNFVPGGAQPGLGSAATATVLSVDTSAEAGNGLITGTVYSIVSEV